MASYPERVLDATKDLFREIDEWFNVAVWAGRRGQTVSVHAALDRDAGKWAGCLICAALYVLVQKNHCDKVIDPSSPAMPVSVFIRAGLCFAVLIWLAGNCIAYLIAWGYSALPAIHA